MSNATITGQQVVQVVKAINHECDLLENANQALDAAVERLATVTTSTARKLQDLRDSLQTAYSVLGDVLGGLLSDLTAQPELVTLSLPVPAVETVEVAANPPVDVTVTDEVTEDSTDDEPVTTGPDRMWSGKGAGNRSCQRPEGIYRVFRSRPTGWMLSYPTWDNTECNEVYDTRRDAMIRAEAIMTEWDAGR